MLCRVLAKRRCLGGEFTRSLSSFTKKNTDTKFHPLPTFKEVGGELVERIREARKGHFLHLTGQYYDHDPALTRNIILRAGDTLDGNFSPRVIMDAALTHSEMKILTNILVDTIECRYVSAGEVNSVGSDEWDHGYVLGPLFTLFSRDDFILRQDTENKMLLHMNPREGMPFGGKLWLKDINHVFVELSERPWDRQILGVRTHEERLKLLEVERPCGDVSGEPGKEPTHEELGEIMLHTEWIVKAAAQLVYITTQNRYKNAQVPLYVPRLVSAEANPWVEMRNSLWEDGVKHKLNLARKDYVP